MPLISSDPNVPSSSGILTITSAAGTGFDLAPLSSGHTCIYTGDVHIFPASLVTFILLRNYCTQKKQNVCLYAVI